METSHKKGQEENLALLHVEVCLNLDGEKGRKDLLGQIVVKDDSRLPCLSSWEEALEGQAVWKEELLKS